MITINNLLFKKIMILFWGLWWGTQLWTEIIGGLAQLDLLHASWVPNNNYPFLVKSLEMYNVPDWLPGFFFVGILLWSCLCTLAFIYAASALKKAPSIWLRRAQTAFIISLSFWLVFFLADQMVMDYNLEANHMVQGGFELLSFLAMYLLPDKTMKGVKSISLPTSRTISNFKGFPS